MRKFGRNVLFVSIVLAAATAATSKGSAAELASWIAAPADLATLNGTASGSLSALGVQDQSGNDDTPGSYVLFSGGYLGYGVYTLPDTIRADKIHAALLQVNFKGPAHTQQTWSWAIYDWNTKQWNQLGDTIGMEAEMWNTLIFRIGVFPRYVSPSRQIHIRFASNNSSGDAKLDYQALHFTYMPVTPTATKPAFTPSVTKAGYIFPITHTPSPTNTPTTTPTPTNTPTATNTPVCASGIAFECQVVQLINQERTSRGLPALASNALLHNAARGHSLDMANNNFFGHTGSNGSTPGQRIAAAGYSYSTWGENIAAGYSTPAGVVAAWMNSDMGHRGIILSAAFTEIGVGYAFNGNSTYNHYWTADFAAP